MHSVWIVLAACKPGTGFDDVPLPTGDTDGDADTDTDADTDADSDADSDADTDTTGGTGDTAVPVIGTVLLNEVLLDPADGATFGDANCDGVRDAADDEFVEVVNVGSVSVDLSGWTIWDSQAARHAFPAGTVLDPRSTIVVFGGGAPNFTGTGTSGPWCDVLPPEVQVVVASSPQKLALTDVGDTVNLEDALGTVVDTVTFGAEAAANQSFNRQPELTPGAKWITHGDMPGATSPQSPGTLADGRRILNGADETGDTGPVVPTGTTGDTGPAVPTGDTGPVIVANPTTIVEVQQGVWPVGTEVVVSGIATAVATDGVYLQEAAGGPYSGVWVDLGNNFAATYGVLVEGDVVDVTGQVDEPGARTTVDVTASAIPSVVVTGSATVPAPEVLSVPTLVADPEPWEGVLVQVPDVQVNLPVSVGNEFEVEDLAGAAQIRIDDQLSLYTGFATLQTGDRFVSITGPLEYASRFKIEPRRDADVVPLPLPTMLVDEILADPPSTAFGDANCDGATDSAQDEFVEIWNLGATTADLSNAVLRDSVTLRHTFPIGTLVPPGGAVVVFGGGTPTFDGSGTAGTWCGPLSPDVAVAVASTGSLSLGNGAGGDTVSLVLGADTLDTYTYGPEANSDTSIVRDPELTVVTMVEHDTVVGAVNAFSPGTLVDGVPAAFAFTPVLDGDPIEWPASTVFSTSAGTTTRLAWDATNLYVAVTHPNVSLGGADQSLVIYVGDGSGGNTTGVTIGVQTPLLPVGMNRMVRWVADDSSNTLYAWNGILWLPTAGWLGTNGSAYVEDEGLDTIELQFPLAEATVTTTLDVIVGFVDETGGTSYAFTPPAAIVDGASDPDYAQTWSFSPRLATDPNATVPVP